MSMYDMSVPYTFKCQASTIITIIIITISKQPRR